VRSANVAAHRKVLSTGEILTPSTLWAYGRSRHLLAKPALICFAFILLVGLIGCNREHDKIVNAPRTESASSVAGWTDVSTSGIALRFPTDWKLIDLTREDFEQGLDNVFGSDPKFAEARSQASAVAEQGLMKLLAFETATLSSSIATNCGVGIHDMPGQATLEQLADASVGEIAPLVTNGTQPKLEYVSLKSGRSALIRSEITPANPSIPVLVSLEFLNIKGSKLVIANFTAPRTDETHIRTIADQVMDAFRFVD
jgi:hypothetical protein